MDSILRVRLDSTRAQAMHVCVRVRVCVCVYIYICMYVYMYICRRSLPGTNEEMLELLAANARLEMEVEAETTRHREREQEMERKWERERGKEQEQKEKQAREAMERGRLDDLVHTVVQQKKLHEQEVMEMAAALEALEVWLCVCVCVCVCV